MKPEGAIRLQSNPSLTVTSFEDALIQLECFPICTLRVSKYNVLIAQRITSDYGHETPAVTVPRVNIVIDETFTDTEEWAVEYDKKVVWSEG